jgi:hypothetical protein
MLRIDLGLVRLAPPSFPSPPRGHAYVYAVRGGLTQIVVAAGPRPTAIFSELTR